MRALTLAVAVLAGVAVSAAPADASCKRFGFTVNDYGKDGPTKDAKELLDKHIAEWAAQNKIKDYKTGSKTVNCELFLNFVVFDEHTCTASANVCWNDGKGGSIPETAAATPEDGEAGVPPTPIRKAVAQGHDKKTAKADAKTTATPPAAADAAPPSDTAAVITPAETPAAAEPTPPPAVEPSKAAEMAPVAPAAPAVTETGTLPKDPLSALKQHAAASPDAVPAPVKSVDAVPEAPAAPNAPAKPANKKDPAAASAAATAAAAAAERAAVAAETAAAAAKEAAAAAVAASAATHGAVVPPIDAGP